MRQLNETNDTASKKKTTASHSRNAQAHNSLCNIPHLTKSVNTEISLELFTTIGHGDYSSVNAINNLIAFLVVFIHKQLSGFHPSHKTQPSTRLVNPRLWLAWIPLIPGNGTLGIESITSLEQFTPLKFYMAICIYRHVYVHIYICTHTQIQQMDTITFFGKLFYCHNHIGLKFGVCNFFSNTTFQLFSAVFFFEIKVFVSLQYLCLYSLHLRDRAIALTLLRNMAPSRGLHGCWKEK